MRILVAGDIHGNTRAGLQLIGHAIAHKAEIIVQCGDFGLWPGFDGMDYLDTLNANLREHNRNLIFVDGNHEDHDQLEWIDKHNPRSKSGHVYLRSNILHAPRGSYWKWGNKYFMAVGGAVSIDKQWRTPGKSWWAGEQLTDDQAYGIVKKMNDRRTNGRPDVDYLFTHDCSDKTPFHGRLKPDLDSKIHRQRMDAVIEAVRPTIHFHGHMHTKYDWQNPISNGTHWVQTYGLECDGMYDNWGILDTDTDTFAFRGNEPDDTSAGHALEVDDNF